MRRRSYALKLAVPLMALAVVASACSNGKAGPGTGSGKDVTVTFWTTWSEDRLPALQKIASSFEEQHKGVKVKVVRVAGGGTEVQKLMAAVTAGTGPDVYFLDRFTTAQHAEAGVLEDLTPMIQEANFDQNQFYDWAVKDCEWQGKRYCIPFDSDTRMLYYNKDDFKKAGLDPEQPPKSIKELDEYAAKLTWKDGNKPHYGIIPWLDQGFPYTWSLAFGANMYNPETKKVGLDDPKFIDAMKWMGSYGDKVGKVVDPFAGDVGQGGPFVYKQVSMTVQGNWYLDTLKRYAPEMNIGVAPIPTADGVKGPVTWAGGYSLVIPKGAKHPKEAFEFMKFFTTDGAAIYQKDFPSFLLVKKSLVENHPLQDDPSFKPFLALMPTAQTRTPLPIGALWWDESKLIRDAVVTGLKQPEEAARASQAHVQAELDKAMK